VRWTIGCTVTEAGVESAARYPNHTGEVVVITGASSGIGAEVAEVAASRGATVALIGRRADLLKSVATRLNPPLVGDHLVLECDVTDENGVEQAISRVSFEVGVPTALVNCAGVCAPVSLVGSTLAHWQQTMDVNLTGTYLAIRAVASRLQQAGQRGSIVNIGSEASFLGMPGYSAYCASKAALIGLTKTLAAELAPTIRVNILCPGPVDTPMLRDELAGMSDPDAAWQSEVNRVPLHRIASARETADAIVWLLWDATYATGSVLALDGGTTGAFMGAESTVTAGAGG
jgi:NAD(P)-dependent dehydrogenase (short-subunit alcohol dehydrogenase family)